MINCVEYLNNFSREKVYFDRIPEKVKITKSHMKNTVYMSFDTETTNVDNKECITYCCSIMEFGKKIDSTNTNHFIDGDKRVLEIFTHPNNFWDYIEQYPTQKIILFLFNSEYDVNNVLNFAIKKYNLREEVATLEEVDEYDNLFTSKSKKLTAKDTYIYQKISRNGKIYKADIQLGTVICGKTVAVKHITIIDMSKKLTGSLKVNVEGFTPLKMNKDDLDYSIFRDYGHASYTDEELLYIWNDTYCLAELTQEYLFSGKYPHADKLTTSSMALACYKDKLCEDMKSAINDRKHKLYKLSNQYYKHCKKYKIAYMVANSEDGKYKKLCSEYNNYLFTHGKAIGEEMFILEKYFTPKDVFLFVFPIINFDHFEYVKASYCGGITRYHYKEDCGKWINEKGIGIDINSSFPYSYTTFRLPYGKGKMINFTDKEMKKEKLYIVRFSVNKFKTKKNREPNIGINMMNIPNKTNINDTWVSEYNGKAIITCTSSDYNYFIENYKYENLQLLDGIEYNCLQGLFDKYTGEFYSIKQNSKGGVKSWAKLNLNGVYGKFGQNIIAEFRKDEYNKELNCIDDIIVRNDEGTIELISEGVYIPVASFVTSYSRIHLLSILNIINDTKGIQWRYCDTDSAYVTGDVNILKKALAHVIDFEDSGQLGLWKIEKYFDKILIIGIKKYIYFGGKDENINYSYHATLSGINNKYFKFIEDYCNIDDNCICEISENDRNFVNAVNEYINFKDGKSDKKNVKEVNYYVSSDTNNPFIYKDKECTQMVKGAYRSIRKKTVKNGQILFNTIYCIKGELK